MSLRGENKMTEEQEKLAESTPVGASKPLRKRVSRSAPKTPVAESRGSDVPGDDAHTAAVDSLSAPKLADKPVRLRKPSREDETVARHHQSLIEALAMAQAIKYDQPEMLAQPPAGKVKDGTKDSKTAKVDKAPKTKKMKLVRNNYAMPEAEYARIAEVKKRLLGMGVELKKSEVLRAGLAVLAALNDAELKAVSARVERIKTGRPKK